MLPRAPGPHPDLESEPSAADPARVGDPPRSAPASPASPAAGRRCAAETATRTDRSRAVPHPTTARVGGLDHARRRYTLTVIDCGTLARQADQIALAKASHVAWVLPATAGAVDRGRKTLDALAPHPSGRNAPRAPRPIRPAEGLARAARPRTRAPGPAYPVAQPARAGHGKNAGGAGDRAGAAAGNPRSAGAMNATSTLPCRRRRRPARPHRRPRERTRRRRACSGASWPVSRSSSAWRRSPRAWCSRAWLQWRRRAPARGWLGFTFPGLAGRPAVAVGILAHNLRSLARSCC